MKAARLFFPLAALAISSLAVSCEDDTSQIGNSLTDGNVTIYVDSLTFNLNAKEVLNENYDSRSGYLLLGSINIPDYGKLNSSFVSRMMCATQLNLPEEVDIDKIDSCRLVLNFSRGDVVGDSLAPQKVNVYRLNQQIPDAITNKFNPVEEFGYSNMQLLGSQSFTASAISRPDSLFLKEVGVNIEVPLDMDFAREIYLGYKNNPEYFQWPQTFAKNFLPGIFVETSFGKGCVTNIQKVVLALFYHTESEKKETVDGVEVTTTVNKNDTVFPFSISPEVLSSNNINYEMAQSLKDRVAAGEMILTTPGGYNTRFSFPAKDIIERYNKENDNLTLISNLTLTIPAEAMENEYDLTAAPTLLLIKTSEIDSFFKNNKIPDNSTSFTASFDEEAGQYTFSSMRNYILDLISKKEITEEDTDFTIIPVYLAQVTQTDNYYGTTTTFITKCTPYTMRPTMTRLHTDKALVVFSFSSRKFD